MLKPNDYKLFLDHVYGLIVVDMNADIVFMSKQFADFISVNQYEVIGKPIKEVFPPTKMDTALKKNETEIADFYFINGQAIASTRIPLRKNGKQIGLVEYDLFQETELLEQFVEKYINLDDELKYFKEEVQSLRQANYTIDNILGTSDSIQRLKQQIRYAARTNSTVIIQGETGTGKELVAHSIHNLSRRSLRNFIRVNAAALPEALFESELFGYEEGTFTGAKTGGKKGKFEIANNGTLFIDEINQMPYNLQPKLLRVLQEQEVDRIGGEKSIPIDVRIIAASNKDLYHLVKESKFREDLYYRLNVVEIDVPPLRERRDDISSLTKMMIEKFNNLLGKNVIDIDDRIIKRFMDYEWPGNVRELQNTIEKAMNFVEEDTLTMQHFDFNSEANDEIELSHYENPIEEAKRQAERMIIKKALNKCNGNKTKTAEYLKIPRTLLYQKMKRLGIDY
ncbi:MAG: sigma 54-interacting transcriptional regulator [Clostridia bacterium]|nr:sigma 54-interacting transcriptional regulator [Clostridia bacterium]